MKTVSSVLRPTLAHTDCCTECTQCTGVPVYQCIVYECTVSAVYRVTSLRQ